MNLLNKHFLLSKLIITTFKGNKGICLTNKQINFGNIKDFFQENKLIFYRINATILRYNNTSIYYV